MKRTIIGLLSVLCISILLTGCDKDDDLKVENNCVTVDGKVCYMLASAFYSGGVADIVDSEGYVIYLFEKNNLKLPLNERNKVLIAGFFDNDSEYTINYSQINHIYIYDIPEIGDLEIPLNRGVYEGENEMVESVVFYGFENSGYERKNEELVPKGKSKIHIKITLKNSKVIEIKYSQKVFDDGLYY